MEFHIEFLDFHMGINGILHKDNGIPYGVLCGIYGIPYGIHGMPYGIHTIPCGTHMIPCRFKPMQKQTQRKACRILHQKSQQNLTSAFVLFYRARNPGIFGHFWAFPGILGHFGAFLGQNQGFRSNLEQISGHFRAKPGLSEQFGANFRAFSGKARAFGAIWSKIPGISGHFGAKPRLSEQTGANRSKPEQIGAIVFEFFGEIPIGKVNCSAKNGQ